MNENLIKFNYNALTKKDIDQWIDLFSRAFRVNKDVASKALVKYKIHQPNAVFCLAYVNGRIEAAYCGILCKYENILIFLSTDTMSSGVYPNATVKLGKFLYEWLGGNNVAAVCGYPNSNIENIRIKKLGWEMAGKLYPYLGIPFLWRFYRHPSSTAWYFERPHHGFFLKQYSLVQLLGRKGLYSGGVISVVFTLSAFKPGLFFIRVPSFFIRPKRFGFVLLRSDPSLHAVMLSAVKNLDLNTIDVP